jgi:hypothetical protein
MRDDDLRSSLATVEGDAPTPEFLAELFAAVDMERDRVLDGDAVLPLYSSEPDEEVSLSAPSAEGPGRHRPSRWLAVGATAAALVVIVGLVVTGNDRDGSQVATSRLPHGFSTAALPSTIVQDGDGPVAIAAEPTNDLDPVVPRWYPEVRSSLDELGLVAGRSVPFELAIPGEEGCTDLDRRVETGVGVRRLLACGGMSAALVFADDVGAVGALDVLVSHFDGHSAGVFGLAIPLERTREVEARLGDEVEAFQTEAFVDARLASRVVVIAWRTDNLVQLLWDIQDRGTQGGAEALLAVAERIEGRTAQVREPIDG